MEQQNNNHDIVSPELIEKAKELILKNDKYRNLQKKYERLSSQRKYIEAIKVKDMMEAAMRGVVQKLIEQEIKERQTTEGLLKILPNEEGEKYRDLLSAMCFCFDTIDYIVADINDLLKRNETGFNVENLPEIKACKQKVASVVGIETNKMEGEQQQLYFNEADGVYAYLLKRCGVFRRKCDKLQSKKENDTKTT